MIVAPIRTEFCQLSTRSVDCDAIVRESSGRRRCSNSGGSSKHVQGLSDVVESVDGGRERLRLPPDRAEGLELVTEEVSGVRSAMGSLGLIMERNGFEMLNEGSGMEIEEIREDPVVSLLRVINFIKQRLKYE